MSTKRSGETDVVCFLGAVSEMGSLSWRGWFGMRPVRA